MSLRSLVRLTRVLVLFVILLLVFTTPGAIVSSAQAQEKEPIGLPLASHYTPAFSARWLFYENRFHGFSIEYPEDWHVTTRLPGGPQETTIITSIPISDVTDVHSLPIDSLKVEIGVFLQGKKNNQQVKNWAQPEEWMAENLIDDSYVQTVAGKIYQQTYQNEELLTSTYYFPSSLSEKASGAVERLVVKAKADRIE